MKRRLARVLRKVAFLFLHVGMRALSISAGLAPSPLPEPEKPPRTPWPPVITEAEQGVDFSWQPAEYQRLAWGSWVVLAPMRWPRRAVA